MSERLDLSVFQGDTYVHKLTWQDDVGTPIDLTGYSARIHVRNNPDDPNIIIELADGGMGIVLGGAAGTIEFTFTSAQTTLLPGSSSWDCELKTGVVIDTLVFGTITSQRETTRG